MSSWRIPANIALSLLIVTVLALTASDMISHKLMQVLPKGVKKPSAAPPPAPAEDLAAFAPILEKGLFGKATESKLVPVTQAAADKTAGATSEKDLVLLGTAIGSFRETFALILKQSTKEERVFRLGDKVFDIGPLVAVRKETAEIMSGDLRIKITAPTAVREDEKGPGSGPAPPAQPNVLASQVGAGSYVIDQRALNAALDNIGQAMTDARLLPNMKDGKVEGFKASEVKPAGVFGMVGIKNGDVLQKINDFPIDSPEKAIQSFVTLRGQSRIKLDILRDGRPTTFTYDIR